MLTYPFTEEDSQRAYNEWGANCGPNALAFALQRKIEDIRGVIPGFEEKRYTSPSMMRAAIDALRVPITHARARLEEMFWPDLPCLVRIQWTGPWTAPGANPKWAYRQTHWIATWKSEVDYWVFDCNGGITNLFHWQKLIVPLLTASIPRADGGWFPTHVWRIHKRLTKGGMPCSS